MLRTYVKTSPPRPSAEFQVDGAAPDAAQAPACEILRYCLHQVAGLSRFRMNIASHNECEEFVFPIRSSTMENTCSGTFLKHYEFIGLFEAINEPVGSQRAPTQRNEACDEY